MFSHYFTLKIVAEKLHEECADAQLTDIFTQEKNTVILLCQKGAEQITLQFSSDGRYFHLLRRESFHRAKKNSLDVFQQAIGSHIEKIKIDQHDRLMYITLSNGLSFLVALIPSKSNLFLMDSEHQIIEQFKRSSSLPQLKQQSIHELITIPQLAALQRRHDELTLNKFLREVFPNLGKTLYNEIITRAGIIPEQCMKDVSTEDLEKLLNHHNAMLHEIAHPSPRIYFHDYYPEVFSVIQLRSCSHFIEKRYDDIFVALNTFLRLRYSVSHFISLKTKILHAFNKSHQHLFLTLAKMDSPQSLQGRADQYERYGSLLMTYLYEKPQQPDQMSLPDIFSGKNVVVDIPLQSELSLVENAQRYFAKAKQCKGSIAHVNKRRSSIEDQLKVIEKECDTINAYLDFSSLKNYIASNKRMLRSVGINEQGEKEIKPFPFRRFKVAGGFEVWAGKSSTSNDELTLHSTDKNDWWFHARSVSGSHVVLKIGTAAGDVSKEAIHQAASIAAYYSKARKAKSVAVAYTQKKYIHKPKGAPAGTVVMEREKVIFVEPMLPVKNENDD